MLYHFVILVPFEIFNHKIASVRFIYYFVFAFNAEKYRKITMTCQMKTYNLWNL